MSEAAAFFARELSSRAESRVDRAVLICAFFKLCDDKPTCSIKDIKLFFERAHLAQPAGNVLATMLVNDPRVSVRSGIARSLVKGDTFFRDTFPELFVEQSEPGSKLGASARIVLRQTPLINSDYIDDLEKMLELYATLHVLENSMRRLIERTLRLKLGETWWDVAASQPQKAKHTERLNKEKARKWVPARSELGPLYSLDWSDLITLMRKYESLFKPFIGDIDFLHRFSDLGLLRHVVAHHGFIDNPHDFERVKLALHDWQTQIGSALSAQKAAA